MLDKGGAAPYLYIRERKGKQRFDKQMSSIEEKIGMWGRERAREVLDFLRRDEDASSECVLGEDEFALLSALYRSRDLCYMTYGSAQERNAYVAAADAYLRGSHVAEMAKAAGKGRGFARSVRTRVLSLVCPAVARAADEGQAAPPAVLALTPLGAAGASAARRLLASCSPIPGKGAPLLLARAALMVLGTRPQSACPHCGGDADPVDAVAEGVFSCRCRYCGCVFKVLPAPRTKNLSKFRNTGAPAERAVLASVCAGDMPDDPVLRRACEQVKRTLSLALREVCVRERKHEGEGPLARHMSPDCAVEALDLVLAGTPELPQGRGGMARRFGVMPLPSAEAVNAARSIVAARARECGRFTEEEACTAACALLGAFKGGANADAHWTGAKGKLAAFAAGCIIPALERAAGFGENTLAALENVERPCGMPALKAEVKAEAEAKAKVEAKAEAEAKAVDPVPVVKVDDAAKSEGRTVVPAAPPLTPAAMGEKPTLTRVVHAVSRVDGPRMAARALLGAPDAFELAEAAAAVDRLVPLVEAYDELCGTGCGSFRCYALLRMAGYPDGVSMEAARADAPAVEGWKRALAPIAGNPNGKEVQ